VNQTEKVPDLKVLLKMTTQLRKSNSGSADRLPTAQKLDHWSLVVAVNNDQVLQKTLLASPAIDGRCQVIPERGFSCTGKAYNAGIVEARQEIIVFAHQDMYLPADWLPNIERALSQLSIQDPNWGVLGLVGVGKKLDEEPVGYCYSTGLQGFVGRPFLEPLAVRSLDEIVLIIRRSSGLTFDENLPGFHFYGTDICLEAESRKMRCYATCAFCVHNTNGIKRFPLDFWRGYLYMRRKWWGRLPIRTTCTTVTRSCGPMVSVVISDFMHTVVRSRRVGTRCDDVAGLYRKLTRST
jgi:hypothetical protein